MSANLEEMFMNNAKRKAMIAVGRAMPLKQLIGHLQAIDSVAPEAVLEDLCEERHHLDADPDLGLLITIIIPKEYL